MYSDVFYIIKRGYGEIGGLLGPMPQSQGFADALRGVTLQAAVLCGRCGSNGQLLPQHIAPMTYPHAQSF